MKSMSYVLRHAAGTPECPISEEGWVKWDDLIAHESCRRYGGWTLWEAVEADAKDRVVATPDSDEVWWVAAWSGHTQERVVGPAAIVPANELPAVLSHGSYRRHTASIQKKGLLRKTRDLHFHDPESRTGKWRLDLETCVKVNVKAASDAGCVFRKTGNDVWLCDRNVPPEAILSITEWDKPRDVPPSGMLFELRKREEAKGSGRGSAASSSAGVMDFNPAALDIPAYRPWQPKNKPKLVTEEVASAAFELGNNLPENVQGGIEVDPTTEEVRSRRLAACIAPGDPGDDDECDWSADDSDVEVVMATPASASVMPKVEIKFGSAHLHLLKAVADADAKNWESLQTALNSASGTAQAKSELVERLEHLADLRVKSMVAAEKSAQEHAQRAQHYTEAETKYQSGLNDAMLRLERMNPVGPRASVPLVSDARLKQDIEAGVPIWVARRAHRARERAARRRQDEPRTTLDTTRPSDLAEVPPEEGGQLLDDAFAASAKANLAEFKQVLKKEAQEEKVERKRKPDSARRKKIKKDRKKERKANSKDDAERDRNHAIAHQPQGSVASFSPGPLAVAAATLFQGAQGRTVPTPEVGAPVPEAEGGFGLTFGPQEHSGEGGDYSDGFQGELFDLWAVVLLLLFGWLLQSFVRILWKKFSPFRGNYPVKLSDSSRARRVGGTRKKVRFNLPRKGRSPGSEPETPFLGGPKAALKRHPPGKAFRLAAVQGRHEFEQEGFALLLSRSHGSDEVIGDKGKQLTQPAQGPLQLTEPCGDRNAPVMAREVAPVATADSWVECILGDWMEWSGCTRPCGGGQQTQVRAIMQEIICAISRRRALFFPPAQAVEDCLLSAWNEWLGAWSAWSLCDKTCSGGQTFRSRKVDVRMPGGCPEDARMK
eukprot:Skav209722  [mRNA]  locus=scaffold528:374935:391817:- [translate_table: standard]